MPATGMIPIVIPMFSKTWKTIMARTPTHIRVPRRSLDRHGCSPGPPHHDDEEQEQQARAEQAELLAHRGEDEVGALLGHYRQVGLGTLADALPVSPPSPMVIFDSARLYSLAPAWVAEGRRRAGRELLMNEASRARW